MDSKTQRSYVGKVLAAPDGDTVVFGIYDKSSRRFRIQNWNWRTGEMLAEFETVFDGLDRMAISSAGDILIAGNWRPGSDGGVAAYDAGTGHVLWHRTDIHQTQSLHYSQARDAVWCSTENGPVQLIDARTGSTLFAWDAVRDAFDSAHSALWLEDRRTDYVLRGEKDIVIPRVTSLFQAEFTRDSVCLIEASGPLRCLEFNAGEERWRYSPEKGHVIRLSYQLDGFVYGVLFLSGDGEDSKLIRFVPDSGRCEALYHQAERNPEAWSIGPGVLLTRSGEVVSLKTGDVIRRLAISVGGTS
jgi:hypothetical protein